MLPGKKRCKLHGGLSTGPKTHAGKRRIRDAQLRRWNRVNEVDNTNEPKRDVRLKPKQADTQLNDESNPTRRKRWRRIRRISPWAL
ncbi:HGGxSTG domain-containing protein [Oricola nitratireducens]|uniref:HGGxSTG domain-containing protein n=1 Tax=Oricola nitratireducens TaxID=2775868 RepID=UPI003D17B3AB